MTTKVQAIICPVCNDIIYSRTHHDMHYCSCGKVFVDGGFDYLRYGGENFEKIRKIILELTVTKQELYDDWSLMLDKYGVIQAPNFSQ